MRGDEWLCAVGAYEACTPDAVGRSWKLAHASMRRRFLQQ
jgi:hypothetical protein